jgi:hypothetical protein
LIDDKLAGKKFISSDDQNYQTLAKLLSRDGEDPFTVEDLFNKDKDGNIFTLKGQVKDIASGLGYDPVSGKLTVIEDLKKACAEIHLSTVVSIIAIVLSVIAILVSLARRGSAKPVASKPTGKKPWEKEKSAADMWNAFKAAHAAEAVKVQAGSSSAINVFWSYVEMFYTITSKDKDNVLLDKVVKANPI